MMKTFDEIYQELKTEDMQEINKLYECVKKKSKNQKRIALIHQLLTLYTSTKT